MTGAVKDGDISGLSEAAAIAPALANTALDSLRQAVVVVDVSATNTFPWY